MTIGGRASSPLSPSSLEGYPEELSVSAGATAQFMLSGASQPACVDLLRLIHGDPTPQGPGFKADRPSWAPHQQILALPHQVTDFGSYLEVPDAPSLRPAGSFTLSLWFYPTLLHGGWQTLVVKGCPGDFSYAAYCGGHRLLAAAISFDGKHVEWCAGADYVRPNSWQLVAITYAADSGTLTVCQAVDACDHGRSSSLSHANDWETSTRTLAGGPVHPSTAPLLFGASPGVSEPSHAAHFNGKIARPLLLGAALPTAELAPLAGGDDPPDLSSVLGRWDLSKCVSTAVVRDSSDHHNDGIVVNAPGRAVTGPSWRGRPALLFTERPEWYDAVHFHEDDLDDARWAPTLAVAIPPDAQSGIYALHVRSGGDEIHVPLVVRPTAPLADVGLLVPTLTWQAYGSNQFPWSFGEDGVLDRGVSLYNAHADGSMVYYVTRRKPTRAWSPAQGIRLWGAHLVTAALYLVDWLEHKGYRFDAFTDEDLHRDGYEWLKAYRCVLLGSHPEYWTAAMLCALRQYTRTGGRVLYLGGNGLYWVTSLDPERQFLMEVRKSGEGSYDERWIKPEPGEYQHSTTLEIGGMWARRGWRPRELVGVEHGADVFGVPSDRWGFRRLDASRDPRFSFVFENVHDEVIGDFGLNLGSAAGYEMDRAHEWSSASDEELVVLARATHPTFMSPKRLPTSPACDLTLLTLPGGGAVFAAGSVTWTGSLSHNDYDNNVSAVTQNVLRRFLDHPFGTPVA